MFVEAYIETTEKIIQQYKPQLPLAIFLKNFFKLNKKFGSRDRKFIQALLYGFYRLGKLNSQLSPREQMLIGAFLSSELPNLFFEKSKIDLGEYHSKSFEEKKIFAEKQFDIQFQIPFPLSEGISNDEYVKYLFRPSQVFIRIRNNNEHLSSLLNEAQINFVQLTETCIALPMQTKIQEILGNSTDYMIQDYSSQKVGAFLDVNENETWWDCCAASGGKSLLLLDKHIPIQLCASDIRPKMIEELRKRLTHYGYSANQTMIADASLPSDNFQLHDVILIDAPCSGSGTWSRNPEQFYFFTEEKLEFYTKLQKQILENMFQYSKKKVYYFTCSVFSSENEELIKTCSEKGFQIVKEENLNAFSLGGDHIYGALLQRN